MSNWSSLSDTIDGSFAESSICRLCERLWLTYVAFSGSVGHVRCKSLGGRDGGVTGCHHSHGEWVRCRECALIAVTPIRPVLTAIISLANLHCLFEVAPFDVSFGCWSNGRLSNNDSAGSITWTSDVSVRHLGGDGFIPLTPAICCSEAQKKSWHKGQSRGLHVEEV